MSRSLSLSLECALSCEQGAKGLVMWAISLSRVRPELRDWLTRPLLGSERRSRVPALYATLIDTYKCYIVPVLSAFATVLNNLNTAQSSISCICLFRIYWPEEVVVVGEKQHILNLSRQECKDLFEWLHDWSKRATYFKYVFKQQRLRSIKALLAPFSWILHLRTNWSQQRRRPSTQCASIYKLSATMSAHWPHCTLTTLYIEH